MDYTVRYDYNVNAGKATVTIFGIGGYASWMKYDFDILPKSIGKAKAGAVDTQIFSPAGVKPEVMVQDGKTILSEGREYTVSVENGKHAGKAVAVITGTGNYTGSIRKEFSIRACAIDQVSCRPIPAQTYTGEKILYKPELYMTINGTDYTLTENKDYVCLYVNNVDKGTASIIITGRGDYEGMTIQNFNIR